MPILNIYVADDMLRFLRQQADERGRSVEQLAQAAVENAAYGAGFKPAADADRLTGYRLTTRRLNVGKYASSLSGRLRASTPTVAVPLPNNVERLRAVAIMRDGKVLERGFKSHWELRAALNPERHDFSQTIPGDIDGFITTADRFVDRDEAQQVALEAGQLRSLMRRPMLSSDLDW